MRVAAQVFGGELDAAEQFGAAGFAVLSGHLREVNLERLGEDAQDVGPRVERIIRVLEDHLDLLAPREEVRVGEDANVLSVVEDLTSGQWGELHNRSAGGRLARAGFADKPDRLALGYDEGDAVHGLLGFGFLEEPVGPSRVVDRKVADFEKVVAHRETLSSSDRVVRRRRR